MAAPPVPIMPPLAVKRGTSSKFSNDEMLRKAKWNTNKKGGDGMSHCYSTGKPLGRLGIFVLEKVWLRFGKVNFARLLTNASLTLLPFC